MFHPRRATRVIVALATALCASVAVQATGLIEAGPTGRVDADASTTAIASTTVSSTSMAIPSTTPSSTTPAPTTTLPQPISPPVDPESPEPVVQLGRLAIPAIGIDRPLLEGIRLPTFDMGPGHWPGSAMPGQQGNMVVGGHRTSANRDFRDLDQLEPGDEMIVTDNTGETFTYVVQSTEITGPYSLRVIHQTPASTATLFACDPPGEVIQRIVVHLTLVG